MLYASSPSGFTSQDLTKEQDREQEGHPETPALSFHSTGRRLGEMGDRAM